MKMTSISEIYPGIVPDRVESAPSVDPVLKGLRVMAHRDEIREILDRHGVAWLDIVETRHRYIGYVRARIEIALLLHGKGWSYSKIGKLMNRHHTTILYWLGRVGNERRKLHGCARRYG